MASRPAAALSLEQARCLQLAAQGLLEAPARRATPAALLRCIARMQLLQIDTIHVVARSPYLVLFARLGDYRPAWLDAALQRGSVFETWAHEACFAPTQDLALHRSYNSQMRRHWGIAGGERLHAAQRGHLDRLLQHIADKGPVKSSDFARTEGSGGGWWGWKDEKRWLEALFARGELMVARRENFHRVYDLTARVHPALDDMALPDLTEVQQLFHERAVLALGLTQARWINDYFRTKPRLKDADLDAWVDAGRLLRVAVEGWAVPGYVHADNVTLLKKARLGKLQATHSALLSPFDPLVWDRERALAMFGFDYRIECYTPEAKRRYGYFVLPVLHRGALVGRLDAKAHRAEGVFEVRVFHAEPGVRLEHEAVHEIAQAIQRCANWHGTPVVRISRSDPPGLRRQFKSRLNP